MSDSQVTSGEPSRNPRFVIREDHIEYGFIGKLQSLKYEYRKDIRDRLALEKNFREKFEALNKVTLTDGEFSRLLEEIITPDVFTASRTLRERNSFTRDDGTPLNYTLVNIKDWCKNTFEVVNQLRVNTDNSHHRYDVLILINGVPCVQIELKTLGIHPRRAMEQIVDYKNDPGNGYAATTKHTFSFRLEEGDHMRGGNLAGQRQRQNSAYGSSDEKVKAARQRLAQVSF